MVAGLALMGVELMAVDAAFYLMFLGAAAVLVGFIELGGADLPAWGQWLAYAVLAVASLVLFRQRLYDRLCGNKQGYDNASVGALVLVDNELAVGGEARVRHRGTEWTARNAGSCAIAAGASARVMQMDGSVLEIEAAAPA